MVDETAHKGDGAALFEARAGPALASVALDVKLFAHSVVGANGADVLVV